MSPEQMMQLCELADRSEKVQKQELVMALRLAAGRIKELLETNERVRRENDALVLDLAIKDKRI
jgi:hypothetical protein